MKTCHTLYPPLDVIEERLFGGVVIDSLAKDAIDTNEPPQEAEDQLAVEKPVMPEWLATTISAACRQQDMPIPAALAPGQIWTVAYAAEHDGTLAAGRIAVLLDAPQESAWQGWVTSPDNDYASWQDVILDTQVLQINPAASMVQLWNRVTVSMDKDTRYLGNVGSEQLLILRKAAMESVSNPTLKGVPGNILARVLESGDLVVTGDRLGKQNDPRWKYREIHFRISKALGTALAPEGSKKFDADCS